MVSERTPGRRHRAVKALTRLVVAILLLAGLGVQSGSAAEDPTYPGLPKFTDRGGWVAPRATGINQVERAKQWIRLPPMVMVAWNHSPLVRTDNSCGRYFPYRQIINWHATGFMRSTTGPPYGQVGPFTARTVAFGSIPVEVSVLLRQPRDAENLPIGIEIKQPTSEYCAGESPYPDNASISGPNARRDPATADGQVEVAISAVKVDGVDLKLAKGCGAVGTIALRSPEHFTMNPENLEPGVEPNEQNLFTTPYFNFALGGLLAGTFDIPAFSGCTTRSGEDVSRLLTATVSGDDNPVTVRSQGVEGRVFDCLEPGKPCEPLPELPFPAAE